jgi:hypothetical protein
MKTKNFLMVCGLASVVCLSGSVLAAVPADYKGTPFKDEIQTTPPIRIPGKLECEYYDFGGKGVAYDGAKGLQDGVNFGAHLNGPAAQNCNEGTPYLCTFRAKEEVAVSYTKTCCDNESALNTYQQELKKLYIGWTPPGEWLNYTVQVDSPAVYGINFLYTAPFPEGILVTIALNNKVVVDKAKVPCGRKGGSVMPPGDGNAWHRWGKAIDFAEIELAETGLQLLTFTFTYPDPKVIDDLGNLDYFEFVKKKSVATLPGIQATANSNQLSLNLHQAKASTTMQLDYTLPSAESCQIAFFDCQGREVLPAVTGLKNVGQNSISIDVGALPTGMYIARLTQNSLHTTANFTINGK